MRRFVKTIRSAFRAARSDRQIPNHEETKDAVARGAVKRVASGNVRTQRGQYITREQMDKGLERVTGYRFDGQK